MDGLLFHLKLGWRNLMRNRRRTFIAGTAIGLGLATLVFTDALILGMENHLIQSGTGSYIGEGRIRREGFDETEEAALTVANLDSVLAALHRSPLVEAYTRRVISFAMIASPDGSEGVAMIGIDPETEPRLSQIDDVMVEGEYFAGGDREIVMGSKLAELIEARLGDRVVLTTAEAETGHLAQELFRVSGIYHFNIDEMDRAMVFIRIDRAQKLLAIGEGVHEITLRLTDPGVARDEENPFWKEFSRGGNVAMGWTRILPQLKTALGMSGFSLMIVGLILFAVVSLGIVNTLFMSLYERMFEFGVLRAVGTRPASIFRLIVSEAAALAVIAIALGIVISILALWIVGHIGIDYTGIEYAGVTFREKIYPVLRPAQFAIYPCCVFALTLLVSIYPATCAARLTPARAMRKSF